MLMHEAVVSLLSRLQNSVSNDQFMILRADTSGGIYMELENRSHHLLKCPVLLSLLFFLTGTNGKT